MPIPGFEEDIVFCPSA